MFQLTWHTFALEIESLAENFQQEEFQKVSYTLYVLLIFYTCSFIFSEMRDLLLTLSKAFHFTVRKSSYTVITEFGNKSERRSANYLRTDRRWPAPAHRV